jgi:hypothetical protein
MIFLKNFLKLIMEIFTGLFIGLFIYYLPLIVFVTIGYFLLANYDNYHIETERKNLFKPVTIVSTKDVVFYEIYPKHTNIPIKIARNDYYLCIENRLSSTRVGCLEHAQGKKLPTGTEVVLSGNARELNESDIGGTYHFYFFEGFSKDKRYWVDDVDLDIMFENVKKLDEFNKKAYKILKKYLFGYLQNQE